MLLNGLHLHSTIFLKHNQTEKRVDPAMHPPPECREDTLKPLKHVRDPEKEGKDYEEETRESKGRELIYGICSMK